MVRYYPRAPALLGHGRGRVLIFSTGFPTFPRGRGRPRPPWKKSFARRAMRRDATTRRRCSQVLLTSSSRRGRRGRENGSRENTAGLMAPDTRRGDFRRVPGNLINPLPPRPRASRSFRLLAVRLLTCREKI